MRKSPNTYTNPVHTAKVGLEAVAKPMLPWVGFRVALMYGLMFRCRCVVSAMVSITSRCIVSCMAQGCWGKSLDILSEAEADAQQ